MPVANSGARALRRVKLLHTAVWVVFAGATLAVPLAARAGRFDLAAGAAALVFGEVIVLLLNRWRCPLTDVAARHTADRRANFDIYLPEWLARHNKTIFGTLYVAGLLYAWRCWQG